MKCDRYGNNVSTNEQQAVDAYIEGVDLFLAAQDGAEAAFNRAISIDPEFSLAYAGLARTLQTVARGKDAVESMERARKCNADLTPRERGHISIIGHLVAGNGPAAYGEILQHIQDYPRDVLAVQPCCGVFGLIGFSGKAGREAEHLAFVSSLASDYGEDWWFETQFAFAQSEVGQLERARKTIERAFAANRSNANAAHYFAHVYYECGEGKAGNEFLASWLTTYNRAGLLHCHLGWHVALWELEAGNSIKAWEIIERDVHPDGAWGPPINVLTDLASFLLRAEFTGEPRRQNLWLDVSDYALKFFSKSGVGFADAHAALAHAVAGNNGALAKLQENPTGPAADQVKVLANVFAAFAQSRWQDVIKYLTPIMSSHERLGGSRAQRDLLEFTMVCALFKLGRRDEATRFLKIRRPLIATKWGNCESS